MTLAATKTKKINTGKVLLFYFEFLGGSFTINNHWHWHKVARTKAGVVCLWLASHHACDSCFKHSFYNTQTEV